MQNVRIEVTFILSTYYRRLILQRPIKCSGVIQQALEPIFRGFSRIIRELLGPEASEQQVLLCLMSIRAQCFGPLMRERRRKLDAALSLPPSQDPVMKDVEALADHVTRFSLAGIRAIHEQIEG